MKIYIKRELDTEWTEQEAVFPVIQTQRLDRELDDGEVKVIDTNGLHAPLFMCKIDDTYYVGNDTTSIIKGDLAEHSFQLTEPSKILQGYQIEGLGVTQPSDLSQRKSLYSVLERLLRANKGDFTITTDTKVVGVLQGVISPQFLWNYQTLLWECLCDIGDVIDAIPRLVYKDGRFKEITFDFVNESETVVEEMVDDYTTSVGATVDEAQYNSQMSAIVANIVEE